MFLGPFYYLATLGVAQNSGHARGGTSWDRNQKDEWVRKICNQEATVESISRTHDISETTLKKRLWTLDYTYQPKNKKWSKKND